MLESHTPHEQKCCTHCGCAFDAFTRNHYFDCKLLVTRDFTDEQRYYRDKLRYHYQRLHGWGVVCGLKVKQHTNAQAQADCLLIEPGTAVDCCGNEIFVREEVAFHFSGAPVLQALKAEPRPLPHRIQVCIRYKECPTEEIPVLFDECGCDETRCEPNRILETYELDVLLDGPDVSPDPQGVELAWKHTDPIEQTEKVALNELSNRLFVLTSQGTQTIYAVDTANYAKVGSFNLPAKGLCIAVSNDGKKVYVAVEPIAPRTEIGLLVLDATDLTTVIQNIAVPGSINVSAGRDVFLAVAPSPDNRLTGLFPSATGAAKTRVVVWPVDLNTPAPAVPSAPIEVDIAAALRGLVISTDGKTAYAADPASRVHVIDLAAGATLVVTDFTIKDPVTAPPPLASKPFVLALSHTTAGDTLVIGDEISPKLYVVPLTATPLAVSATVALANEPIALVASSGGNWIYVLESDGPLPANRIVEPISLFRIQAGKPQGPAKRCTSRTKAS
jgi:DNA-binding beta-propeller fold protein YncE